MTTPMALDIPARKVPARRRAMAWVVLATATLGLRALRFCHIERLARLLNHRAARTATVTEVTEQLDAIDHASPWVLARVACLERSFAIVLWCGLRRRSVCWCLGIRTPPFAVHSWVEVDGQPVGELVPVGSYVPLFTVDQP